MIMTDADIARANTRIKGKRVSHVHDAVCTCQGKVIGNHITQAELDKYPEQTIEDQ